MRGLTSTKLGLTRCTDAPRCVDGKKAPKIIQIEKIMPKRIQKQTGLYKLSPTELANLNAWLNLNLAKARDVLPVSPLPPAF